MVKVINQVETLSEKYDKREEKRELIKLCRASGLPVIKNIFPQTATGHSWTFSLTSNYETEVFTLGLPTFRTRSRGVERKTTPLVPNLIWPPSNNREIKKYKNRRIEMELFEYYEFY